MRGPPSSIRCSTFAAPPRGARPPGTDGCDGTYGTNGHDAAPDAADADDAPRRRMLVVVWMFTDLLARTIFWEL